MTDVALIAKRRFRFGKEIEGNMATCDGDVAVATKPSDSAGENAQSRPTSTNPFATDLLEAAGTKKLVLASLTEKMFPQ
jgi:hypothetical protein